MRERTTRPCWKCGQIVPHQRASWCAWAWRKVTGRFSWRFQRLGDAGRSRYAVVPYRHYVEKSGSFQICRGSEALP